LWSDLGAVTGELADDSGNVVDLIERKYKVKLTPTCSEQNPNYCSYCIDLKCLALKGPQAFP